MRRPSEVRTEHLIRVSKRVERLPRDWPTIDQCPPSIEQSSGQWQRFAIEALSARVDRIESAQRPSPPPSPTEARHGLSGMLAELRRAVIEDEVEADAIYLSLKRALAALRRNSKPERLRTFALGMVHDALLFTSLKQVTQDGLDGLASAVALATKDELSDSCLDQIEDLLQLNGFELVPIK